MPIKEGLLSDPFVKMVWCRVLSDAVTLALVAAGVVIVIGFLSNYLFSHTGLPAMLFLIALGLVLGPVLQVYNPASVIVLAPLYVKRQ